MTDAPAPVPADPGDDLSSSYLQAHASSLQAHASSEFDSRFNAAVARQRARQAAAAEQRPAAAPENAAPSPPEQERRDFWTPSEAPPPDFGPEGRPDTHEPVLPDVAKAVGKDVGRGAMEAQRRWAASSRPAARCCKRSPTSTTGCRARSAA